MQNSNPSHHDVLSSRFAEAFARALERAAAERLRAAADALATGAAAEPGERTGELLLGGAELLRVVREPVEWLLALAHRLADSDPVDRAAVDHVWAAFHARLAGRPIGVRTADLLTVFGLLVGALDPGVVLRALSETLGDGLAAMLGADPSLVIHVAGGVDPFAALWPRSTRPRSTRAPRTR